eukprot:TRINITY_DN13461_c0_g1_i5.p1 TRINITY_DN13461_c0_g1~~TRINITY_DN13461_c0_g1_i5.p1  ORF type:complete len:113 (-),score=23.21 TRINITY_DN13461_c0_g1_i5:52-390(-)
MIRRPPRSTLSSSSAASDVYKRQIYSLAPIIYGLASILFSKLGTTVRLKLGIDHLDTHVELLFKNPHSPILSLIHISEPTRLLSISYAVFCLKKKKKVNLLSLSRKTQTMLC